MMPEIIAEAPDVILLPSVRMTNDEGREGDPIEADDDEPGTYDLPGFSHIRHAMVQRVARKGLVRPPPKLPKSTN
jgi:hypothetical protein